jgi:hypothetical protein
MARGDWNDFDGGDDFGSREQRSSNRGKGNGKKNPAMAILGSTWDLAKQPQHWPGGVVILCGFFGYVLPMSWSVATNLLVYRERPDVAELDIRSGDGTGRVVSGVVLDLTESTVTTLDKRVFKRDGVAKPAAITTPDNADDASKTTFDSILKPDKKP